MHLSMKLEPVSVPNIPFWSCAIAGLSMLLFYKDYEEQFLVDDEPANWYTWEVMGFLGLSVLSPTEIIKSFCSSFSGRWLCLLLREPFTSALYSFQVTVSHQEFCMKLDCFIPLSCQQLAHCSKLIIIVSMFIHCWVQRQRTGQKEVLKFLAISGNQTMLAGLLWSFSRCFACSDSANFTSSTNATPFGMYYFLRWWS